MAASAEEQSMRRYTDMHYCFTYMIRFSHLYQKHQVAKSRIKSSRVQALLLLFLYFLFNICGENLCWFLLELYNNKYN